MLESPVPPGSPPGHASSSLPPPTYSSIKEARKLLSPSSARLLPSFRRCGIPSRGDGEPSVPAIDSRPPAPPPRPSIRLNNPGSGRVSGIDSRHRAPPSRPIDDIGLGGLPLRDVVPRRRHEPRPRPLTRVDDPRSGRVSSIESRHPGPPPRPIDDPGLGHPPLRDIDPPRLEPRPGPLTRVDDPRPGRFWAINSRPSGPGPRPSIRVHDSGSGHVSAIDSRPAPPPRPVDDPASGQLPLPAIDSCRRAPPPRPVDDPASGPLPLPAIDSCRPAPRPSIRVHDPGSGRVRDINSLRLAPRPRPSIRVDDPGSGRVRAANSRRPTPRPRLLAPGVLGSCKPFAAPNKEVEEAENEIQMLNELHLGDDITYEEYMSYLEQLPRKSDVDTSTKLDDDQLKELNTRHALYRIKYYQLSQQVPEDDKLKKDYPPSRLEEERYFKSYEDLDWSFHPDYCKLAGLEDYQRLVPRNYGGYEYVGWDEYRKDFHSYDIEQEYIKYCEDLSKKLKWMEAYVPNKSPSLKAIKIATDFSKITGGLASSGFYEWLDSMTFDVCTYNELDGVYYEIWQRHTNETKFRDVLDEVYELNRFPLRQDRMRCALGNDTFCSDLEEEFLACTTCLKEFTEDKARVREEKARELIAEALRKQTQKPKFYEDYCRKKIDIARAIGLISS